MFENEYATFRGDRKVLNAVERQLTLQRFVPFPSNEHMLLDAGNDLKNKFAEILEANRF